MSQHRPCSGPLPHRPSALSSEGAPRRGRLPGEARGQCGEAAGPRLGGRPGDGAGAWAGFGAALGGQLPELSARSSGLGGPGAGPGRGAESGAAPRRGREGALLRAGARFRARRAAAAALLVGPARARDARGAGEWWRGRADPGCGRGSADGRGARGAEHEGHAPTRRSAARTAPSRARAAGSQRLAARWTSVSSSVKWGQQGRPAGCCEGGSGPCLWGEGAVARLRSRVGRGSQGAGVCGGSGVAFAQRQLPGSATAWSPLSPHAGGEGCPG